MRTFLDQTCWENILLESKKLGDDDIELWHNFRRYIKGETDLILNISETKYQLASHLFNDLTTGRGSRYKVMYDPGVFHRMKGVFENDFDNADNYFLLSGDSSKIDLWRKNNGYLIDDSQSLFSSWRVYRQLDSHKFPIVFPVRPNDNCEFNLKNFAGLSIYKHPATDIILADRYVFNDRELLKCNFVSLINAVIKPKKNLRITIFGSKKAVFTNDVFEIKQTIEEALINFPNVNLEIVLDDDNRFQEHDRKLITNYFSFVFGQGVCLFSKSESLKTKGTEIYVHSLFNASNLDSAKATARNLLQIRSSSNSKTNPIENRNFLFD